jgi:hypothetical protein
MSLLFNQYEWFTLVDIRPRIEGTRTEVSSHSRRRVSVRAGSKDGSVFKAPHLLTFDKTRQLILISNIRLSSITTTDDTFKQTLWTSLSFFCQRPNQRSCPTCPTLGARTIHALGFGITVALNVIGFGTVFTPSGRLRS